jgi:hypothetical protein
MPLLKLGHYQKKFPELKDLLPKFDSYLEAALSAAQEKGAKDVDIVPAQVAKKLGIKEGLALALLMLAEEEGVVESAYQLFCPTTDNFLGEYKSLKDTPAQIECPYHSRETVHDSDEYLVDAVFHFAPQFFEEKNALAVHS